MDLRIRTMGVQTDTTGVSVYKMNLRIHTVGLQTDTPGVWAYKMNLRICTVGVSVCKMDLRIHTVGVKIGTDKEKFSTAKNPEHVLSFFTFFMPAYPRIAPHGFGNSKCEVDTAPAWKILRSLKD